MRRILAFVAALVAIGVVTVGVAYVHDRDARLAALEAGATRIDTALGPVEYRLTGSPGQPVLAFLHGTPGGHDQGPPPEPGARVLTISRPGYLGTPLSSGASPADQAHLLAATLDALGIERVALMGASGGGPAAYHFALAYPERTLALIAMEAISHPFAPDAEAPALPESDLALWLMLAGLQATRDDAGVVRTIMARDPDLERILADPVVTRQVADLVWSVWPPSRRSAGMRNDQAQFATFDADLSAIRVPTLIVHGTRDESVPFVHAEHAAATIPGAELHALEGAGHLMPFAHAQEVDRVVDDFLARQAPAPGA
jgi:pimeloyl-ACP methyl ester carboxylesterase